MMADAKISLREFFGLIEEDEPKLAPSVKEQIESLQEQITELKQIVSQLQVKPAEQPKYLPDTSAFLMPTLMDMVKPDPTLAEDEWYVVFSDYRDLSRGVIQKTPWMGGSNMTSTFKVKRIP